MRLGSVNKLEKWLHKQGLKSWWARSICEAGREGSTRYRESQDKTTQRRDQSWLFRRCVLEGSASVPNIRALMSCYQGCE